MFHLHDFRSTERFNVIFVIVYINSDKDEAFCPSNLISPKLLPSAELLPPAKSNPSYDSLFHFDGKSLLAEIPKVESSASVLLKSYHSS